MKTINKIQEKWITYPDDEEIKIKVRKYPLSSTLTMPNDDKMFSAAWERFNYCVVAWTGINNEDGTPFECTEVNKKYIFDYSDAFLVWITSSITKEFSDSFFLMK